MIWVVGFVSAAPINDTISLNIQTTWANGSVIPGPVSYVFNFNITESSSSSCLNPVYNDTQTVTTDVRGITSAYLPTVGSGGGNLSQLDFDKQYYMCYYRDGTLKDVFQLATVPYSFKTQRINLSEVVIDSNLTLGDYNVSASSGFFSFLGSLTNRITSLFVQDVESSGYVNVSGDVVSGGDVSVTGNVTASWFRGIFNWIIGESSQNYLSFNGTQLDFSESALNNTIDTKISVNNESVVNYIAENNVSVVNYVDGQDVAFNQSVNNYIAQNNLSVNNYIVDYVGVQNDSLRNYLLGYIAVQNGSLVNYIAVVNDSMKNYVDYQ
ncbi:MAG: hypothetical protein KKB79_00880, partial [Nanoarchaeota archaeon]|nr:hypothetical protein [Nanoarchaeota archaeon]